MNNSKKRIVFFIDIVLVLIVVFLSIKIFSLTEIKHSIDYKQLKENIENNVKDCGGNIGVYIKDLTTGKKVSINEDLKFPAASIIKIPLMAVVYEMVQRGKLQLGQMIKYQKKHYARGSGKIKYCKKGRKFSVKQLLELMIEESDNIATNMLTDEIGLVSINEIITNNFGLNQTSMNRYVMDLASRDKGIENYTTPQEIALLLEKIYKKELVSKQASDEMLSILMKQKVSDRIPRYLPKGTVVAHKTGLMSNLCHDAGIIFTDKGDFIVVVFTKELKINDAKDTIAKIALETYKTYQ